jgi:hypothetical protein
MKEMPLDAGSPEKPGQSGSEVSTGGLAAPESARRCSRFALKADKCPRPFATSSFRRQLSYNLSRFRNG